MYFTDTNRQIQYWNKGAEKLTGFRSDEVVGHCCKDNILKHVDADGNPLCIKNCPLSATLKDGESRHAKVFLHHKDGHRVPVHVAIAPIYDEAGKIIAALETFHDLTREMSALKEVEGLEDSALLCPLTGLGNRSYAEKMLNQKIDLKEELHRLAVLSFDVDQFKGFNTKYGNNVGDIILKMVGRTLANNMREFDFLARWADEEFIAFLPGLKPIELEETTERFRKMVESASHEISKNNLTVTVSIGATFVNTEDTSQTVFSRVNALMDESIRRGQNRVTIARQ